MIGLRPVVSGPSRSDPIVTLRVTQRRSSVMAKPPNVRIDPRRLNAGGLFLDRRDDLLLAASRS